MASIRSLIRDKLAPQRAASKSFGYRITGFCGNPLKEFRLSEDALRPGCLQKGMLTTWMWLIFSSREHGVQLVPSALASQRLRGNPTVARILEERCGIQNQIRAWGNVWVHGSAGRHCFRESKLKFRQRRDPSLRRPELQDDPAALQRYLEERAEGSYGSSVAATSLQSSVKVVSYTCNKREPFFLRLPWFGCRSAV